MASYTGNEFKVSDNSNSTDVKVVFDPTFVKTKVAKKWQPQDISDNGYVSSGIIDNIEYKVRTDGIYNPIIKIDTQVISTEDIQYMRMNYTGFRPTIDLTISKASYLSLHSIGMANKLTLVMIPPVDGTYKKISIDFYIDSVKEIGNSVKYHGKMFFPALEMRYTKAIRYNDTSKLTTWQMLYAIASECKLGFACTDMCKNVPDTKTRLMINQNYQEVIKDHIRFAGTDASSIFDSWIDVYGYLVMDNVSWVLSKSVSVNELSIKQLEGINIYDKDNFPENPIKYGNDTFRTFTNWKINTKKTNNEIKSYEWIVNNNSIKVHGTDNIYYIVNPISIGGNDMIDFENIKVEESSADGENFKDAYRFQKNYFIGTEMGSTYDGNTPILLQEKRHNALMAKLNSKMLKITLKDMNINLERGMLINVAIYEYDLETKNMMMDNADNLSSTGNTDVEPSDKITGKEEILNNANFGIPNYSISGIYYINGIEYIYDSDNGYIEQSLYLIRHTRYMDYLNNSSLPKYTASSK